MTPPQVVDQVRYMIYHAGTMVVLQAPDQKLYAGAIIGYGDLTDPEKAMIPADQYPVDDRGQRLPVHAETPVIKYGLRTKHLHGVEEVAPRIDLLTAERCQQTYNRAVHVSAHYAEMVDQLLEELQRLAASNASLTQQVTALQQES
jgi:hypothetical protein